MIMFTPANNFCGHGLYQFSPTLFFSLFSEKNGFTILDMSVVEKKRESDKVKRIRRLYKNMSERERLEINTKYAAEIFLVARKVSDMPLEIEIQQSDYLPLWESEPKMRTDEKELFAGLKTVLFKRRFLRKLNGFRHNIINRYKRYKVNTKGVYKLDSELHNLLLH